MEAIASITELPVRTKVCARCKVPKPTTDYQRDRTHGDGLKSSCKACRNQGRAVTERKPSGDPQEQIMIRAQSLAARKLIENHLHEYKVLVAAQLKSLGYSPKWRNVAF